MIAWLLGGPEAVYTVPLPGPEEPKRAILETYTKEHSAEYQAQALIDLTRRLGPRIGNTAMVEKVVIYTSHHTHYVIGSASGDPQKYDPAASRETLDHSLPYIFAVALRDGGWHHIRSYERARAARPDTVRLWRKITTAEDEWTRRYHDPDPGKRELGAGLRSPWWTAACWPMRSRWRTLIQRGSARSPVTSTSPSSAP